MSTSILYHGFRIYGYWYVSSQYQQGAIVFTVIKEEHARRCPSCQGRHVCRRGAQLRWFHTLPDWQETDLHSLAYTTGVSPRFFGR